jgi:hypothetical protein
MPYNIYDMAEVLNRLASRFTTNKRGKIGHSDATPIFSKIDKLDLSIKPSDILPGPYKVVSEQQLTAAAEGLSIFSDDSSADIIDLEHLNDAVSDVGNKILSIIDARGHRENIRENPAWVVRKKLGDAESDTVLAFAYSDLLYIERYTMARGAHKSKYTVYLPRTDRLEDHATDSQFGKYFAMNYVHDDNYYPEKNPYSPRDTRGYFIHVQRATHDLLQATGLLEGLN